MTYHETKKYLETLSDKKKILASYQSQLIQRKQEIDGLRSVKGIKVAGGQNVPAAETYVENVNFLEEQIVKLQKEIFNTEDDFDRLAENLSPVERMIVRERYIRKRSWRQIQSDTYYGESQPYKILQKAIKKLSKIL